MEEITITVYLSSLFSYSVVAMVVAAAGAWVETATAVALYGLSYFSAAVAMVIVSLAATTIVVAAAS